MVGTEKQVKWAEDIKANAFKSIQIIRDSKYRCTPDGIRTNEPILGGGYFYDCTAGGDIRKISEAGIDEVEAKLNEVFGKIEKASVIIDRRDLFSFDVILNQVKAASQHLAAAESTEPAEPTESTEPATESIVSTAKVTVTEMFAEPDPNAALIVGELDKLIDSMTCQINSLSEMLVGRLGDILSPDPDCPIPELQIREIASKGLTERRELREDLHTIQSVRSKYDCAMGGIMSVIWFDGDTYEPAAEEKDIINRHYSRFVCYNHNLF